jgi:DNA-binding NarL/FixJ family response regulator
MAGIEIVLLIAGCIFMVGSFFVTEKLSPSELNKISELSEDELKKIIERELLNAGGKIEDAIDNQLDASMDRVERALEKETNEKIMAISEYSDTVLESMNKTHNEIMFLYSMLNDKHTELTGMVSDLQHLAADVRSLQEAFPKKEEAVTVAEPKPVETRSVEKHVKPAVAEKVEVDVQPEENSDEVLENHNNEILDLHKEGLSEVEIAKRLELGVGEVRLVLGLYRGANS